MSISYLTAPQEIGIAEANAVFDALDDALRVLFNGQSPLLYLPVTGPSSCREAGLLGVLAVFGTKASRNILSSIDSHDQSTIDSTVNAAAQLGQDDTLKQVTLDLASGYLGTSLVAHQVLATPPVGPDELYWVRQEFVTGSYQHEHPHELAVVDVVFEGHASRSFTWLEEWNKFKCIRFHNLDSDSTPLVVTMESTGETISLDRWQTKTVRLSADGTSWEEVGFLLWRMRSDDLTRFGHTMPWNDRRQAEAGSMGTVWTADGANNVASWALVWWLIDYFSNSNTPAEVATACGDGVGTAFDKKTGFHFDLSDITRNAGTLAPFPDPTSNSTPIYQLALHGGRMTVVTTNLDTTQEIASGSPSVASMLAGDAGTNLQLEVDVGGMSAHLKLVSETGVDYADVIPTGTSIGASGHPFEIPADGTGYNVPPFCSGIWYGIRRWAEDSTKSETVLGIGTTETTTYNPLKPENSSTGAAEYPPFEATVGDVKSWTFPSTGTKNNTFSTFMTNSTKWDGRRVAVNVEVETVASSGRYPNETIAAALNGSSSGQYSVTAEYDRLNWFQSSTIQDWPTVGGIWFTPSYARRAVAQRVPADAHPHVLKYNGDADGNDWIAMDTRTFPRSSGPVQRQVPLNGNDGSHNIISPPLSTCYLHASDSTELILRNISTEGWWASTRENAIANEALSDAEPPCIAVPIMARHYNVLAQRLNALLTVYPFSYFDAQYYGTPFRPDYSSGGIFGGYIYPSGFLCYSTGSVATRASALSMTVRDFRTVFASFDFTNWDVVGVYGSSISTLAFDSTGGTGWNAWNKDLPRWFKPDASVTLNECSCIDSSSPGSGWTLGGFAYSAGSTDFYWYQKDNPSGFDFPDFDYIRADDAKAVADSLGIPFRLIRLSAGWTLINNTPDRIGLGSRVVPVVGGGTATRTEIRLVPYGTSAPFVSFAGTGDPWWGTNGLIRVSDWPVCPATQGSDDATVQMSNVDPMHGLNRTGSGDVIVYPYGYIPSSGTPSGSWDDDAPFEGEARYCNLENYDTTPTPPTGWNIGTHRLGTYPVPITQWGASDIESQAAPSVDAGYIALGDLGTEFEAADLWAELGGSGSWSGEGAFAVHLVPAGVLAP